MRRPTARARAEAAVPLVDYEASRAEAFRPEVLEATFAGKGRHPDTSIQAGRGRAVTMASRVLRSSRPSLWAAPQSLQPPPVAAATPHPDAEKYKRRVTRPDMGPEGPAPAGWQRFSQLLGGGLSLVAASWFVFWADFGPNEHCFSPIRRFVGMPQSSGSLEDGTSRKSGLGLLSRQGNNWEGLLRNPEDFDADEVLRTTAPKKESSDLTRASTSRAAAKSGSPIESTTTPSQDSTGQGILSNRDAVLTARSEKWKEQKLV
ncbi:unnamed protein product [Parajaminaea phylloscopi]